MMRRTLMNHQSWKMRLLFATIAVVAVLIYSERPAPGAGTAQPLREFFLPQFGHGGNPDSLNFSTTISLINLSTTTSQISVIATDPNGSDIPLLLGPSGPTPSVSVQIPGSGTAQIQSASESSGFQSGAVSIFSFNQRIVAQTEFSISIGDELQARAQVPARQLTQRGSFPIGDQGRTGLAVLNPFINDLPAEVLLASVSPSGSVIGTGSVMLMPGEQISRFLDEFMNVQGATSAEFRVQQQGSTPAGAVVVRNQGVALLPLQQDGLVLTTQDVYPPRSLEALFADQD